MTDKQGAIGHKSSLTGELWAADGIHARSYDTIRTMAISAAQLLEQIAENHEARRNGQIAHVELIPAREPKYASLRPNLPQPLVEALQAMGIRNLYTHQVEAIHHIRQGKNVVVVTSTSSGKTLSYNLPIFESLLKDPTGHALYLFPLNALVNDQVKAMVRLNRHLDPDQWVRFARYTGQMNQDERLQARGAKPQIYLTNPEMLHLSFLGSHDRVWRDFWANLRFVVIDEVHVYRGVFGSNVAQLLRRLRRVCHHYGSDPQFICCSATIANPGPLAEDLIGQPFTVVDNDGSGSGMKLFVMWNPPPTGEKGLNLRRSYVSEAVTLFLDCVKANFNTILFARARKLTERMLRLSQWTLRGDGARDLANKVSSYRAGYLTEQREQIERKLKDGSLKGVISTNALELGIDIGELDAAILASFPGTVMSTWQQAGRAGRRGRDALIMLVASQNPVDQYYVRHPTHFFGEPHEHAVVDLNNPYILFQHLLCGAHELPITQHEWRTFDAPQKWAVAQLERADLLERTQARDGTWTLGVPNRKHLFPHREVSLRTTSQQTYRILDTGGQRIGTIEPPNVFRETHQGAIYQHQGESYRVLELDRTKRIVRVKEDRTNHYTRPLGDLGVSVSEVYDTRPVATRGIEIQAGLGRVIVQERIHTYQEVRFSDDEVLETVVLPEPYQFELETTAMWLLLPEHLRHAVTQKLARQEEDEPDDTLADSFTASLHGLEHLLVGVFPLLIMCDRRDVQGFYHVHHPGLKSPTVFVYDQYKGGIGLAEKAFRSLEEILPLAFETVEACGCEWGCPSCVQSGTCRSRNELLNKGGAAVILSEILGQPYGGVAQRPSLPREKRPTATMEPQVPSSAGQRQLRERVQAHLREVMTQAQREAMREQHTVQPKWRSGDRVWHLDHGAGTVLGSKIEAGSEIVTIRFDRGREPQEVRASEHTLKALTAGR